MKKAFTLIELLVVIAIIAILAAILFPVFAQAKAAAKKSVALSNQKQIGLGLILYTGDYDDTYPRNDGCVDASSLNSSLNTVPNAAFSTGCTAATATVLSNGFTAQLASGTDPFAYGLNHFSWQKWVMPYVKNVELFKHPGKQLPDNSGQWSKSGNIDGSFALNLGVTGSIFARSKSLSSLSIGNNVRDSYWGGTTTGMHSPAENMILMEISNPTSAIVPTLADATIFSSTHVAQAVNYPWAIRETWMREFFNWSTCTTSTSFATTASTVNTSESNINTSRVFGGGINCGFVDGHAKFLKAGAFLAKTPSAAEYVQTTADSFGGRCGLPGASGDWTGTAPNMNIDYPFWGLGN